MTEAAKPKVSRAMRAIFVLSLALNLLVVGLLAGAIATGGPGKEARRAALSVQLGLGPVVQALDPASRRDLGRAMRKAQRDNNLTRAAARAGLGDLAAAVSATPFERATLMAVLATQSEGEERRTEIAQALLADRISEMSDEERATFAVRLAFFAKKGPPDHKKGGLDRSPSATD